jgi:hypothetical protein
MAVRCYSHSSRRDLYVDNSIPVRIFDFSEGERIDMGELSLKRKLKRDCFVEIDTFIHCWGKNNSECLSVILNVNSTNIWVVDLVAEVVLA